MLEEFMAFNNKKMPNFESNSPPKYRWSIKINKSLNKSIYSDYSKINMESIDNFIEQEMSLAEKVMQRQLEEKTKLEEKKKKILKELHKKKKINVKKFLTREIGYEQKKLYSLEQKRFKELEEENKKFKDKPILNEKTIEIYNNINKNKKPIYLRTKEILENKEKNLENLNSKIKKEKLDINKLNKSMDKININNNNIDEYIVNNEIKNKKMTKKQMVEYYNKQKEWKNKINEDRYIKDLIKNEIEEKKYKLYFHPKISRGTEEIILAMNEAKENYLCQNTESNNSNNYYYLTDNTLNQNYLNYDNNVFNRLYEIKKKEKIKKNSIIFHPTTNKNKYKKIESKYKKENIISRNIKKINKKILGNKKDKKSSVDTKNTNKSGIKINLDEIKSKKENNPYESWTNHLLKLKKNKSCEISYKLNIRQSSAWNENDVNIIPFKGESREIVKNFL